jgi:hypothetical protein
VSVSAAPDTGAAGIAMVVNPTTFDFADHNDHSSVVSTPPTDDTNLAIEQMAQELGFESVEDLNESIGKASVSEATMTVHGNGMKLAGSGEAYPYAAQFASDDLAQNTGLHLDLDGEGFEAYNLDQFIDWTDPIWGIPKN